MLGSDLQSDWSIPFIHKSLKYSTYTVCEIYLLSNGQLVYCQVI